MARHFCRAIFLHPVCRPAARATIGTSYTSSATVTDNVFIRSVTLVIIYPDGVMTQSFSAANTSGDTWSTGIPVVRAML